MISAPKSPESWTGAHCLPSPPPSSVRPLASVCSSFLKASWPLLSSTNKQRREAAIEHTSAFNQHLLTSFNANNRLFHTHKSYCSRSKTDTKTEFAKANIIIFLSMNWLNIFLINRCNNRIIYNRKGNIHIYGVWISKCLTMTETIHGKIVFLIFICDLNDQCCNPKLNWNNNMTCLCSVRSQTIFKILFFNSLEQSVHYLYFLLYLLSLVLYLRK